jgi:hypothetical protein
VLWWYASSNRRLLAPTLGSLNVRELTIRYLFGPTLYLAAAVLALVSVPVSVGICLLLAVFFAIPTRFSR